MIKQKGSFTVEASIIVPILLFVLIIVMRQGVDFYQETNERKVMGELQNWDAVEMFYNMQNLEEIGEEIQDD